MKLPSSLFIHSQEYGKHNEDEGHDRDEIANPEIVYHRRRSTEVPQPRYGTGDKTTAYKLGQPDDCRHVTTFSKTSGGALQSIAGLARALNLKRVASPRQLL